MKRLLSALLAIGFCLPAFAQDTETVIEKAEEMKREISFDKNLVKLNLFALPTRSISLQYERALKKKISVALGVRLQPKGGLPFKRSILNMMGDDSTNTGKDFIENSRISNWAITPEFRYYFGKKPVSGFYVAPFVRIGGYSLEWNYKFKKEDNTTQDVSMKGTTTSFSGGLLLGAQWHVGKHFLIDWWILGPMIGKYNLKLEANTDLTSISSQDKQKLEDNIEGIGLPGGGKFKAEVNNSGVKAENSFSMPGLRTGLCIGYTF